VNVERARELARFALASLEANRQRIDDLNVYPVPDGDTGTNLVLTVRAVVDALDTSSAAGAEAVAKDLSRAALMGARGNSGVIFSQMVRGFAEVLGRHEEIDGTVLAEAFRSASDAAYRAVRRPVEGTMLTVVREMAEEAERREVRGLPKGELLARVVERGEEALARTPDLLPILAQAGVVDAGGAGLVEIVRGLTAGVRGEPLPESPARAAELGLDAVHQELSRYRYCTVFVVEGENLDLPALERSLERLGDSLLVVGDASALKVHVHTDDPGAALSLGTAIGTIDGVEIANMHLQTLGREERLSRELDEIPTLVTGVVAVAPGVGNRRLFEALGATRVIEGGQTMNPSTEEILRAVEATPADEVIVLPNNRNVELGAEHAAALATKVVRVVPTTSVPAGIEAMVAYNRELSAAENEAAMLEALADVVAGEIVRASRDTEVDGLTVRAGQWLGLVEDRAIACGDDVDPVVDAVVDALLADGRETLTILVGEDAPDMDELRRRIERRHPAVTVDPREGGQPHYPLLLAAV
jgi:DAK2 domain fusion protein YloV